LGRWRIVFVDFAAIKPADMFDGFFVFSLLALELTARIAKGAAAVAEFLEFEEFVADAAEHDDDGAGLFEVEAGAQEELGVTGGDHLEADFGQFGGVVAEEVGEGILLESGFEEEGLFVAPLAVAAAGGPVGDVARGELEAALLEGAGDFLVGDGVGEHVVDHVAFEFGQVGDFAVARFGLESAGLGGPEGCRLKVASGAES